MTKYRYLKIKDICGETYEFEDCKVDRYFGRLIVDYIVPIGTLRKIFFEKNLISWEFVEDSDISKEE